MEILQKGGRNCTIIKKNPFWEYVGNRPEFMRLSIKDREKVFLRWKHGGQNHDSNLAVEYTDQYLLGRITDENIKIMNEFDKWFWTNEKEWWAKCHAIKVEIGIATREIKEPNRINPDKVEWEE